MKDSRFILPGEVTSSNKPTEEREAILYQVVRQRYYYKENRAE